MSNPKKSVPANECLGCGFEPSNKRHYESYWKGSADPRDRADDKKHMWFNSNVEKVIDRQIAEIHHTMCLGNGSFRGTNQASEKSSSSSKK